MLNAAFREWEFLRMEKYLQKVKQTPVDSILMDCYKCMWCDRTRSQYYPDRDFIIVYLEDFKEKKRNKKSKKNKSYQLLLDFFSVSDFARFTITVGNEKLQNHGDSDDNDRFIPRSTLFTIDDYQSPDVPIKRAHYYLNLWELRNIEIKGSHFSLEGFPLLCSISLNESIKKGRLLYLTTPLIYPQWVFSGLQNDTYEQIISNNKVDTLRVWDVWQGNYNELMSDGKAYVIYDAGTDVFGKGGVSKYKERLKNELKNNVPLFVLSHWHTDHYSILFSLDNDKLRKVNYFIFPSYVKSLNVFLFIVRLQLIDANVIMKKLPFTSKWVGQRIKDMMLYTNMYSSSSVNDSGLTLFVKGKNKNAMLPGDCKYTIAEGQANDAIEELKADNRDLNLVVPHHGGNAGKKVTFSVANAKAKYGFISVGEGNGYHHPKKEVLDILNQIFVKVKKTECEEDREGKEYIEVKI